MPSKRLKIALSMLAGACIGGGFGYWMGGNFPGDHRRLLCAVIGLPLGAVAGLDVLLPPPGRTNFDKNPSRGPFYSAAYFVLASAFALGAGFFTYGSRVEGELVRQEPGEVTARRVVWMCHDLIRNEETFRSVTKAGEDIHGDLLLTTDQEHPQLFAGFRAGTDRLINQFLSTNAERLSLTGNSYWYFTVIFLTAGLICAWLACRCLRNGLSMLGHV